MIGRGGRFQVSRPRRARQSAPSTLDEVTALTISAPLLVFIYQTRANSYVKAAAVAPER